MDAEITPPVPATPAPLAQPMPGAQPAPGATPYFPAQPWAAAGQPVAAARRANYLVAAVSGFGAALVGAAVWGAIVASTHYEVGYVAVGIGLLVGVVVRVTGGGQGDALQGALGATLALVGCVLGFVLAGYIGAAGDLGIGIGDVFAAVPLGEGLRLTFEGMKALDYLFLGIAAWAGFKTALGTPAPRRRF